MTQATAQQLISHFSGLQTVAFFLVLARIAPLFILAPIFSSKMLPKPVRAIVAVALAIGLTAVASHGQHLPTEPVAIAGLMVKEFLVGLAFALAVGTVFSAVQMAGSLIDQFSGMSFGSMVDPVNGASGGAFARLYGMVGLMLFIAIGGDAWMLRGLARTFDLVPLTASPNVGSLVGGVTQAVGQIFVSAVELAAPVMLALLITDIAFGIVTRVVPQMNVFAVGFPVKIIVSLLVVGASLPFLGGWMSGDVGSSIGTALHMLRVG
jgi:flagellar biosynthetic protein FliR